MNDIQTQFVKNILKDHKTHLKNSGNAFAPSNIALCKYWGKRDTDLNLPINSSLSISLANLGTHTTLRVSDEARIVLNGIQVKASDKFSVRLLNFLELFKPILGDVVFEIETENNIPTAAGLASSASGFAALVMALNDLAGWDLDKKRLSMLARLGSGSASRSVFNGFVQWNAGESPNGMDSFSEKISCSWSEFRIGILEVSDAKKPVGSREGMNHTLKTSELYNSWPKKAKKDFKAIRTAIDVHDFKTLGKVAENNALSMHATMMSAWPSLIYFQPQTIEQIHKINRVRNEGLEVYFTMDAGPNIKLLFLEENEEALTHAFAGLKVVAPFD